MWRTTTTRGTGAGRHVAHRRQNPADVLVLVAVDLASQERHQRVDDDQRGGLLLDEVLEQEQVGGELGRPWRLALRVDVGQDPGAAQVGAGGLQPWADGVADVVLGREQDDIGALGPGAVGERRAGGHLGRDRQRER
jgi:hypothetical protein